MKRWMATALGLGLAFGALQPLESALAAAPQAGTISKSSRSVEWTGGPFLVAHPACPTPDDPLCDHFFLTVDSKDPKRVTVAITADSPMFDYVDVEVYAPDGTRIALGDRRWGYEELDFTHTPDPSAAAATYEIRVYPVVARPGVTYRGSATLDHKKFDPPRDYQWGCGGQSDQSDAVTSILEPAAEGVLPLEVMVLVDGVQSDRAREIVSQAEGMYSSIGIDLVPTFEEVDFTSEGADLMGEAQATLPEEVASTDVTYILTSASLGLAEGIACVGGIADPHSPSSSIAVGVDIRYEEATDPYGVTGASFYNDTSAVAMAHEIGHVLGAVHEYSNCVEARITDVAGPGRKVTPCTVMSSESTQGSGTFSTIERNVIRKYVDTYAGQLGSIRD